MKQLMIINTHSMIDVITNSSTELFIVDESKTVEFVKDILNDAIRLHNKIENTNLSFSDIFEEITVIKPNEYL